MTKTSLFLQYGRGKLRVPIPAGASATIIRSTRVPSLDTPESALDRSLSEPIGTASLEALCVGKRTACVVISDNTRPVPNRLLLRGIIDRIKSSIGRITILVANGLHKALERSELEELVGSSLLNSYRVVNHVADDPSDMLSLGSTSRGIPISLNKAFLKSDLRIATGLVEPHFMAGYSGGRKSICPGIAGRETIQYLHSPALLESSQADFCRLQGNPVHEESLAIAKRAGVDFIVNVAIDDQKRVTRLVAGDLEKAWAECVRFVSRSSQVHLSGKYDVVITSNGGYPQDRSYYQAVKGLVAAARILKPNGAIIMAAECCDGLGSDSFRHGLAQLKAFESADEYIRYISQEQNFRVDQWEVEELVKVLRKTSRVFLLSEAMNRDDVSLAFATPVSSIQEALSKVTSLRGAPLNVAVIPEGPYVVASPSEGESVG